MADRENVKIVISAALIVIVASLGIYAFIYRDNISQLLPRFGSSSDSTERRISPGNFDENSEDNISDPFPNPSDNKITPPVSDSSDEEEIKGYPTIPQKNPDNLALKDPSTLIDSPKDSIETIAEKKSPSTDEDRKNLPESGTKTSLPPTVKKSYPQNIRPSSQESPLKSKSTTSQKSVPHKRTTTSPKSIPHKKTTIAKKSSTKPVSVTKKKSTSSPTYKKPSSAQKPVANTSSTLESRVNRLEKKFQVHVQDTNTRLDALESRIERLEKKLSSPTP